MADSNGHSMGRWGHREMAHFKDAAEPARAFRLQEAAGST